MKRNLFVLLMTLSFLFIAVPAALAVDNQIPTVTSPGYQQNTEGDNVQLQIEASDPEGDTLSYSLSGMSDPLPTGLTLNSTTGLISGTIADTAYEDDYDGDGIYYVEIAVSDNQHEWWDADYTYFTWTVTNYVNQIPTVTNPGYQQNTEGDNVTLQLTANDPDGDTLVYSAAGLPAGLNIDPDTGVITGTIADTAYEDAPNHDGIYTVTVEADDGINSSTSVTFTWTVTNSAQAFPTVRIAPVSQEVGQGSDVLIDINVEQIVNLYAADLNVSFDPAVLRVAMIGTGQDLDGDGNEDMKPDIWINLKDQDPATEEPFSEIGMVEVDNQTGEVAISATRTGNAYEDPYVGFDGDATLATIRFKTVGQGYTWLDLTAELRGNAGAEDSDVYLIQANVEGGEVTVSGYSGNVIEGWVRLEGTPDPSPDDQNQRKAGTEIHVASLSEDGTGQPVYADTVWTDEHGRFQLSGLPDGSYHLVAHRPGYLNAGPVDEFGVPVTEINVADGQVFNVGKVLLLTGDLTWDNWVELGDLDILRGAYHSWIGDANWNEAADLDWNDHVGLIDLILLARNFAREGAGGPQAGS